jgi:CRISPR/Cas system-associated exonuclease Cas4 (RecB family)
VATPAVVPTQSISFISIPMQAEVKVDGRPLGPAPFEAELTRGSHTVTMSLGGTVLATSLSVNRRGADTIRCDFQENRCTTEYSSH